MEGRGPPSTTPPALQTATQRNPPHPVGPFSPPMQGNPPSTGEPQGSISLGCCWAFLLVEATLPAGPDPRAGERGSGSQVLLAGPWASPCETLGVLHGSQGHVGTDTPFS